MKSTANPDVLIIGAGPAGCAAAMALVGKASVRLVDWASFPRDKVCGCCLNGAGLRALDRLGVAVEGVPLHTMKLCFESREMTVPLSHSKVLSRSRLDVMLVEKARAVGVEVSEGTTATTQSGGAVELKKDGTPEFITPRVVIIATGLRPGYKIVPGDGSLLGVGTLLPRGVATTAPGVLEMVASPGGYVGMVMLEDGRLDVSAALSSNRIRTGKGMGGDVASLLPPDHRLREALTTAQWRGAGLLRRKPPTDAARNTFHIGDAFAYAEPFTGEGIAWALESGLAVAPFVERALRWDADAASDWVHHWSAEFARKTRTCRAIGKLLERPKLTKSVFSVGRFFPPLVSGAARLVGR